MTAAGVVHLRGPLLLGPDEEVAEAWVVDGRLTFTAPGGDAVSLEGWVLPGLADAHCHIGLDADGEVPRAVAEQQALTDRDAGTLLVRDAGQPGDTRWIDDRDDLPVVIRAGRHIARSRRYIRNYGVEIEPAALVETVREQAGRGDGWVKLVGDWIDRDAGDLAPCWPLSALRPAIAAAHELGARVTAHCFGEECLPDLMAAGIDCIEHACGLTTSTVEVAAAQGIAIVPTLINIATFPSIASSAEEKFPTYAAHLRALHERRQDTVLAAFEAGVPVYAGTDAGGSLAHGRIADEVRELHAAGLSRTAALAATTWSARAWLGRPGLSEGAPADLVVYAEDPRLTLDVLAHPSYVVLRGVVRRGLSLS
jgi:imidazolonepropionase-like amidohydrolase